MPRDPDDLIRVWCRESSYTPHEWTPLNPAWGQCAATALAVKELRGGHIVRCRAELPDGRVIPHYFNILPDGREYDLTLRQFPSGTVLTPTKRRTPVGYTTKQRRDILLDALYDLTD